MRILLTGDLHLGRSSSGVRSTSRGLRTEGAWGRIVELAVERGVGAVLLSGDIIDHSNRYFEAWGPLTRGLSRLAANGIPTLAIAGNHDHSVLGAMALECAGPEFRFQLLGRQGAWEQAVVEEAGRPALRVLGWSFPSELHARDPLETFPQDLPRDLPLLGLVHGDLDTAGSRYAPLDRARLAAQPVAGWLLGHIHAPRLVENRGGPWILYPGSPQALDPGEEGVHGIWIAEVLPTTIACPVGVPVSTVRYERIAIDVGGVADEAGLRIRLREELQRHAEMARSHGGESLHTLVTHLTVEGGTPVADAVEPCLKELQELPGLGAAVTIEVRQATNRATPPLDIPALAQGPSLVGVLARLVQALESGAHGREVDAVMARARDAVGSLTLVSRVQEGDGDAGFEFGDDALRRSLATAARKLLAGLLTAGRSDGKGGTA
ncbi:MAG TPA: DNA repair exonuclease [Verrucomicrobiota bacterium]|nr:DNA repair exonuclease [Verrucomicrobiota bacterium]HNU51504.1 DNA repair exonuclease [Verrucomicrobiota bacterium]